MRIKNIEYDKSGNLHIYLEEDASFKSPEKFTISKAFLDTLRKDTNEQTN